MAAVWLFDKGRLDRVPTRDPALRSLLPDVLAVLPKARAQHAPRRPSSGTDTAHFGDGECPEAIGAARVLATHLASTLRQATGVHSQDGGLEAMESPPKEVGHWLTYAQAARRTGWSIRHLRNLVSGGRIPVYGRPRVRRFRRDMLDLFLTNPDAAMRKSPTRKEPTA